MKVEARAKIVKPFMGGSRVNGCFSSDAEVGRRSCGEIRGCPGGRVVCSVLLRVQVQRLRFGLAPAAGRSCCQRDFLHIWTPTCVMWAGQWPAFVEFGWQRPE